MSTKSSLKNFPSRQVHLDFHTSEHIPSIGEKFDKNLFQSALRAGHLDSITLFAKCHHGWCYYPTKIGHPHPNLKRNLLKEQVEAAHEIGVRAPIYITYGWSANDAQEHPEWVAQKRDGTPQNQCFDTDASPNDPRPPCSWLSLFPHPTYIDHLEALTREICEQFTVDGIFYDIVFHPTCVDFSEPILAAMDDCGFDRECDEEVLRFNHQMKIDAGRRLNAVIRSYHPDATVFYNSGAELYEPEVYKIHTHYELEDLPTFWGGYDKFPFRAKYFSVHGEGKPYLAMSGKFHTEWGEFGGYKHPDAIRYEVAQMVAFGAGCSFGDQVHPSGKMALATYRNIGVGYAYQERIAEFGLEGEFYSNLGILPSGNLDDDQGVCEMLLEEHLEFEVVNPRGDWSRFDMLILPNGSLNDASIVEKLKRFVAEGKSILAMHNALLDQSGNQFAMDCGATLQGQGNYEIDYSLVGSALAEGLPDAPFLNYESGIRVKLDDATTSLGKIYEPYFDRTYATYCSHRNTPYQVEPAAHPLAWKRGNVICLAHPIGLMYHEFGARVHRTLFKNALDELYKKPIVQVALPSTARISLRHQPEQKRYCLHILYAPPIKRGLCEVIEDFPPLHEVKVALQLPASITEVSLPLEKMVLPFNVKNGMVEFSIPKMTMHSVACLEYV